eukprot:GILI01003270.1.p1 GENE.GILI01003270.1~~GILI01003270.1.p1  ORF type:complete len:372 (-),score=116.54 GILI01003270.1:209-1324(-)
MDLLSTLEPKTAKSIERRRNELESRRTRVLDAKTRTMGVDLDGLNAQVEEKSLVKQQEAELQRMYDEQTLLFDNLIKKQELEKQRRQRELEASTKDYNLQYLRSDLRKDYDLNDPESLKKSRPARESDDDDRCGPASLQKFSGEDLSQGDRRRMQQLQQQEWVQQQLFEKEMKKREQEEEERRFAEEVRRQAELRKQMETMQEMQRRELSTAVREQNLLMSREKKYRERAERMKEQQDAEQELRTTLSSPWMTEMGSTNRKVTSEYKGMSEEERRQILEIQKLQQEEKKRLKEQELDEKRQYDLQAEAHRRFLVSQEREAERKRQAVRLQVREMQKAQNLEVSERYNHLYKEVYTNSPSEAYFSQFGTSAR